MNVLLKALYFAFLLLEYTTGQAVSVTAVDGGAGNTTEQPCSVQAVHERRVHEQLARLRESGVVLVEYNLRFPDYPSDPLADASHLAYRPNKWKRIFSKHGQTLLHLPFDYKALSLSALSFGVESNVSIELNDTPQGCLGSLSGESKLRAVEDILTRDFRSHAEAEPFDEFDQVCHQVISADAVPFHFEYECCTHTREMDTFQCDILSGNKWISYLYTVINIMDVLFFLFGPLIAVKLMANQSYRVTQYIVQLTEPHVFTIKKQLVDENPIEIDLTDNEQLLQESAGGEGFYSKYKEGLTKLTADTVTRTKMSTLYVQVDHRHLMSEKEVSVGLSKYLWRNLVLCRMRRYYPFSACCNASVFGTWTTHFFCLLIPTHNRFTNMCIDFDKRYRARFAWKDVFKWVGLFMGIFIVISPFVARRLLYRRYQKEEYAARREALEPLGLSVASRSVFSLDTELMTTLHNVCLGIYAVTAIILIFMYRLDRIRFTEHMINIYQDLRHIKRLEGVKVFLLHILTPVEKFGILGFLCLFIYLPIVMPVVLIIVAFYAVPTLYLLGRFLFPAEFWSRCFGVDVRRIKIKQRHGLCKSFEEMFMLRAISPPLEHRMPVRPLNSEGRWSERVRSEYSLRASVALGLTLAAGMVSVLILYAECFRFLVEVCILTLMGAMVNAGSAGQYFMLSFFLVTYMVQVFNNLSDKYQTLLSKVFAHIKDKLDAPVAEVIRMRGADQKSVAFKFFSQVEINELYKKRHASKVSDFIATNAVSGYYKYYDDRLELVKNVLHWRIHSLIFFIDRSDEPRIPKALFEKISALNVNGTPGPVHVNILIAMRQLFYMITFLFFVVVVVLAFGDAYKISSTNQLLLTLVGGLVPFIVFRIMLPKINVELDLTTYSFQGKIHEIIEDFTQSWPVYDLDFIEDADARSLHDSTASVRDVPVREQPIDEIVEPEVFSRDTGPEAPIARLVDRPSDSEVDIEMQPIGRQPEARIEAQRQEHVQGIRLKRGRDADDVADVTIDVTTAPRPADEQVDECVIS